MNRFLIVNADYCGMTKGITDGILEAHTRGIVTSTSLMVNQSASSYAANRLIKYSKLSIGLHAVVESPKKSTNNPSGFYMNSLEGQLSKFVQLIGTKPTHFDSHAVPQATKKTMFYAYTFALKHKIPFRGKMANILRFYGMQGLTPQPEKLTVKALSNTLNTITEGRYLLICHPGKTSNRLSDPYKTLRYKELQALTSETIKYLIKERNIVLTNFTDRR